MTGMELKLRRIEAGLTQWGLAKKAGIHPARISEMERDQRPVTAEVMTALEQASREARPG